MNDVKQGPAPSSNAKQLDPKAWRSFLALLFVQELSETQLARLKRQMEEHNNSIKNQNPEQ